MFKVERLRRCIKAGTSLSWRGRRQEKIENNENQHTKENLRHHQIFLVILRCKVLVSWFFWLFENAGKLARGIFWGLLGLQGGGMEHFWGLQGLQGVGMVHFWGLHELQVKKKGAFLLLHGVQTPSKGPFSLFARCVNLLRGGFLIVSRTANSQQGSFFTLCTVCKPLARGIFSREAEVTTRKAGESQTFLSFYLFKKGWKSWGFSLECGFFICVAYEDVNVATGDVCDV